MPKPDPWSSLPRAERLRESYQTFTEIFPPNPYKYGVLKDYSPAGKKNVITHVFQERGEVSDETWPSVLAAHFQREDEGRVGYLPGNNAGTTAGCIDVDQRSFRDKTESVLRSITDAATTARVPVLLERSTGGGWHIWVFAASWVPYETMRDALRHIVHVADVGVLETYPMGSSGPRGRWVFVPYAGTALRDDGLGRTYLQTLAGDPIPVWEAAAVAKAHATARGTLTKLAALFQKSQERYLETASEPGELSDTALEQLRSAARTPPDGFDRHHSVFAFVNVAEKAGRGREMLEYLQSDDIWKIWVAGKSGERSPQEWTDELERIWETVQDASELDTRRFGIPFLSKMGWEVPELERRISALGPAKGWTKAVDDDTAAQWAASQLESLGNPLAYEAGTPFVYDGGTWYPLQGHKDATTLLVERVLRPQGARIMQDKTTVRVAWMLSHAVEQEISRRTSDHHLALANGLLDMREGKLVPWSREVVTIGRVPVTWARMSRAREDDLLQPLRAFLEESITQDETHRDLREILVEDYFRAWAWAMDPARRGRFFLDFHGPSSTGKSTAVKAALMVLGDAADGDPKALFTSLDADALEVQDFTAALVGRQGVHLDDLALSGDKRSDRRVINFLKKVAGGAVVNVNRKYQASETTKIHARAVISTNDLLTASSIADTSALNMRAWRLGFFGRTVEREEQVGDYEKVLLPTEEHRLAFLRRLVRYWRTMEETGTIRTDESVAAQRTVFGESDDYQYPVLGFFMARCSRGTADDLVGTSALVESYNEWAKRNGERRHDGRTFGSAMKHVRRILTRDGWKLDTHVWRSEGNVVRGWRGVRLRWGSDLLVDWEDEDE